jgi:amino acid transporter
MIFSLSTPPPHSKTGLCYSELSTRFPLGGSAYVYAYATLGELPAFLLGWAMLLEYSFGSALAARTAFEYVQEYMGWSLPVITSGPSLFPDTTGALPPYLHTFDATPTEAATAVDLLSASRSSSSVEQSPQHSSFDSSLSTSGALVTVACFALPLLLRARGSKVSLRDSQLMRH